MVSNPRHTLVLILSFMAPWLIAGAVLGLVPAYQAYQYVWKDPRFCSSCHVHDYANTTWKKNVHGKFTTCQDCHHQPLMHYTVWSLNAVAQKPAFPKELKRLPNIPRDLCESCHTRHSSNAALTGPLSWSDLKDLPKVEDLFLHNVHMRMKTRNPLPSQVDVEILSALQSDPKNLKAMPTLITRLSEPRPVSCMDCHGGAANRGHDVSVADRSCLYCHANTHQTNFVRQLGCKNCHYQDFLTPLEAVMPIEKKPATR